MPRQLFEVAWAGHGRPWSIREYSRSFDSGDWWVRIDLERNRYGRDSAIAMLREFYPGCRIRVTR